MAKILVFNNDSNRIETYYRNLSDPMPYNSNGTLKVREFRGSSNSNTLWTTKRTMQSWNSQRYVWGKSINVGFAFKRSYEGGHSSQSQHYAGTAFDVGQLLSNTQRNALRNSAKSSGIWSYVEPVSISPTWVHFDKRFRNSRLFLWWFSSTKKRKHKQLCTYCPRQFEHTWLSNWWS